MKNELKRRAVVLFLAILSTAAFAEDVYRENADALDPWNPKPHTYNTDSDVHGYGSSGNVNPNALQVDMQVIKASALYDSEGNALKKGGTKVIAERGLVGYYDDSDYHNGKIHAGAIADILIKGVVQTCTYVNAVGIKGGGTHSGWVKINRLIPKQEIKDLQREIYNRRESSSVRLTANSTGNYVRYRVINKTLSASDGNSYIKANRSSGTSSGKGKYYYIRENTLTGYINLPETGDDRHGVACQRAPIGAKFWRDQDVDYCCVRLYAPDTDNVVKEFRMCFGYFKTNADEKIYCWTNRECLTLDN